MRLHLFAGLALAASLFPLAGSAQTSLRSKLDAAMELLRAGHTEQTLAALETLRRVEPDFRPAQLLQSQLLAIAAGTVPPAIAEETDPYTLGLLQEAQIRLAGEQAVPPPDTLPNSVLQLAPNYRHLVVVDLSRARLYLLENVNGRLKLLRQHYAAIGKSGARKQIAGDNRTPVGLYHITGWLEDRALPELYGAGALPLDYPNLWDRFKRRTGSGIWLHGVPRDTHSRPPLSSEGCVTMANGDLLALKPFVDFKRTPVLLSDELQWVPESTAHAERDALMARVDAWRQDWMSRDTDAYLAYYAADFSTQNMDLRRFSAHKHRVNAAKRYIDIDLKDVSLFRYPGADTPLWLAEFTMDYRSDNFRSVTRKQQFWKRDATGQWVIFREENQ